MSQSGDSIRNASLCFSTFFPHNAEETKPQPSITMKTIIRSILLMSLTATVLGLSSCQTAQSKPDEMSRMNHPGMRMN